MQQYVKLAAPIFALFLSTGSEASPGEAVSYKVIKLRLPEIEKTPEKVTFAESYDARLRLLLEILTNKAVGEFRGRSETPVVQRDQFGMRGEMFLLYVATPERTIGYILPFYGQVQSKNFSACRFEFKTQDLNELPRMGGFQALDYIFPSLNCQPPRLARKAIFDYRANLQHDGYRVFANVDLDSGSRAAVIEPPDDRARPFDIETALDIYAGTKDPIVRSVALPIFDWRSGWADTVSGRRLFSSMISIGRFT